MIKLEYNEAMFRAVGRAVTARNFVAQLVPGEYLVVSGASGGEYFVMITREAGETWACCTCKAGEHLKLCHHIPSALWVHDALRRLRLRDKWPRRPARVPRKVARLRAGM